MNELDIFFNVLNLQFAIATCIRCCQNFINVFIIPWICFFQSLQHLMTKVAVPGVATNPKARSAWIAKCYSPLTELRAASEIQPSQDEFWEFKRNYCISQATKNGNLTTSSTIEFPKSNIGNRSSHWASPSSAREIAPEPSASNFLKTCENGECARMESP